ncbi:MAG TPA: hypothetical protein PKH86_07600 [Candidatus Fermentibacter daniensis]|nr:MAG: hypothetical protein AO395_08900 [Candidatus Fermentibacter daniensis]HOA05707.1 hypothetical protein [Candidatus Fermentibacter daniensis]
MTPDPAIRVMSARGYTTGLEAGGTVETDLSPHGASRAGRHPAAGNLRDAFGPPRRTFRPNPEYPAMARRAGIEGRVILQIFVPVSGIPAAFRRRS